MAETIESFVAKLQTEGIEAGKQAASKLLADARNQADEVIGQAGEKADKIVANARSEAKDIISRAKMEMKLAVRDDLLRLQESLVKALEAVLAHSVEQKLMETEFLSKLLHDLVMQYAQNDIQGRRTLTVKIKDDTREKLSQWAIQEMAQKADRTGLSIHLQGTLDKAGFEYSLDGSTVEITTDSVVRTLSDLVGPELRRLISEAVKSSSSEAKA